MLQGSLAALYARGSRGIRLGLASMREACAQRGNPERSFQSVHIAGTNGKGSTSAMIASIARAMGLRVGLYTSPHLARFAERIQIDGRAIDDEELATHLDSALTFPDLSFFEVATLAAFLAFRAADVDLAVLEVGLGGRLDATNVVEPASPAAGQRGVALTAITSIDLDHQALLGDTIAAIAREKAGIAKPGVPLLIAPSVVDEARAVILEQARAVGAPTEMVRVVSDEALETGLRGYYQQSNRALARALGAHLGATEAQLDCGIRDTSWPGRFEWVAAPDGPWILDAAHNPEGARALVTALTHEATRAQGLPAPGALLYGAMADKDFVRALRTLEHVAGARIYTVPKGRRAATPTELSGVLPGRCEPDVEAAMRLARSEAGARPVLVAGSIYLVGEVRARLLGLPMDPPIAM